MWKKFFFKAISSSYSTILLDTKIRKIILLQTSTQYLYLWPLVKEKKHTKMWERTTIDTERE